MTGGRDADDAVRLGPISRSLFARWWLLVAGVLLGAIIGLLFSIGDGKQWTAREEIYLGTPLANGTALTSSPTSLGLAAAYVDTPSAVLQAARASGIPAAGLSGSISAKPILGSAATPVGQPAPLLLVAVTGSKTRQIEPAADELATSVVSLLQPYTKQKLVIAKARLAQEQSQVGDVSNRLKQALDAQAALATSARNQPLVAEYAQTATTLANERSLLDGDITSFRTLISQTQAVEVPRIVSSGFIGPFDPSRRQSVLIGALVGLIVGALTAVFWEPIRSRRALARTQLGR